MIGRTVGSYRIVRQLGAGGMGVVYVAEHALIGRQAAVKVLLPRFSAERPIVDRFFNEARAATRIKHRGIIEIFDFGYADDGSAYIVMELLEGESLSARLEARGRLPEIEALRMVRQIAGALDAAHGAGIIHRDLKPDNVFLIGDAEVAGGERIKVLDFGIAKLLGDAGNLHRTRTGEVLGSPLYMSPEQCSDASDIDGRADVYALGCVMYHMVCGEPPFDGTGVGAVLAKHIYEPPPPPSQRGAALSAATESLLLRMLAKQRDARPPSMKTLSDELVALAARAGELLTSVTPAGGAVAARASWPVPAGSTTLGGASGAIDAQPDPRRRRTPLLVALGAITAVLLIGGAIVLGSGSAEDVDPAGESPGPAPAPAAARPPPVPAPSPAAVVPPTPAPSPPPSPSIAPTPTPVKPKPAKPDKPGKPGKPDKRPPDGGRKWGEPEKIPL